MFKARLVKMTFGSKTADLSCGYHFNSNRNQSANKQRFTHAIVAPHRERGQVIVQRLGVFPLIFKVSPLHAKNFGGDLREKKIGNGRVWAIRHANVARVVECRPLANFGESILE